MRFLRLITTAGLLLTPGAAAAQEPVDSDPPAHVSFVEGAAVIERDGTVDNSPANMPVLAGDRIRTEEGRVEILYADGSTLHIDHFTTVDFQSDELVRVLDGRVRLTIAGRSRDVGYRIDGPNAWAQVGQPGEYRFAITRGDRGVEVELAVLRGAAELVNDDGRTPLRAGERAFAHAGAGPSYAYVFNSASWDAFDRWSEARRDYRLGISAQYLPEPVRPYSRAFDRYGAWQYEPSYGYVWYPAVAAGWRPYYYGRWATLRPYGWVWIGNDPWAWPTHHYGRWGFSAGAWFWIPGRTWGPAWVSWAYTPAYVSWCPLGWNNRPIFQIVNVYSRGYDPWRAWTVVRRDHFGRDYVHRRVVAWDRLDARTRGNWEFRDTAPEFRGYAVPRSQAPIRVVGRAVPRGGGSAAPISTNQPRDASRVEPGSSRIPTGGAGSPGTVNRDPRSRAVPRGDSAVDVPRMVPERGVRSAPAVRTDEGGDLADRPHAVQRNPAGRSDAPPARSGERDTGTTPRRAPVPQPRSPGGRLDEVGPDRGVRSVPRDRSSDSAWGGAVRTPSERRAPDAAPSVGVDRQRGSQGWGNPGTPAGRRAPERPPQDDVRAVPRRAPESRPAPSRPDSPRMEPRAPEMQRPPSMPDPPQMERRAPPSGSAGAPPPARSGAPDRARPSGGGDGGQARRRRDG